MGPESDVFSLATLLVFAATGRGPFESDSPYMTAYQVVHEAPRLGAVPDTLRVLVEPCLDKDPEGRPSVDELLTRLLTLPDGFGPASARPGAERSNSATRALGAGGATGSGNVDAPADEAPADLRTVSRIRTGLRRRWRSVLAAAVAVAAVAGGVALLGPGGGPQDTGPGDDGRKPSGSGKPLPEGFAPWEVSVRGGRGIPDELRCVPRGVDVYCGGGGVVATRLRAADGKRLWTVPSPGVPTSGMHFVGVTGTADEAGADKNADEHSDDGQGDDSSGATVVGYRVPADRAPTCAVALTEGGKESGGPRRSAGS